MTSGIVPSRSHLPAPVNQEASNWPHRLQHQHALRVLQHQGFDEYMNLVLDDAEEINVKKNTRKTLGRILLKGDNITLMMNSGK
uniref:Small nuclear ribonucleoprotein E n=1 Tax=Zea mays TaxID=4577 RepID=A0A804UJN9_MAIZE